VKQFKTYQYVQLQKQSENFFDIDGEKYKGRIEALYCYGGFIWIFSPDGMTQVPLENVQFIKPDLPNHNHLLTVLKNLSLLNPLESGGSNVSQTDDRTPQGSLDSLQTIEVESGYKVTPESLAAAMVFQEEGQPKAKKSKKAKA
jgi:hypothetical protein